MKVTPVVGRALNEGLGASLDRMTRVWQHPYVLCCEFLRILPNIVGHVGKALLAILATHERQVLHTAVVIKSRPNVLH